MLHIYSFEVQVAVGASAVTGLLVSVAAIGAFVYRSSSQNDDEQQKEKKIPMKTWSLMWLVIQMLKFIGSNVHD